MSVHKLFAAEENNTTSTNEVTPDIKGADDDALTTVSFYADGTWGSATMSLQCSADDGTTWHTLATKTADGVSHHECVATLLRLEITGGTGANLDAWLAVGAPSTEAAA